MSTSDIEKVRSRVSHLQDIVSFQASNGLLDRAEAVEFLKDLKEARDLLDKNAIQDADLKARITWIDIVSKMGTKPRKLKLLYLWGIHVWIFLVALSIALLVILLTRILNQPVFMDVSGDTIVWGGLGGCAYSIYFMRKNIYEIEFSKYYAVYWFVYPVAGMIFGFAIVFVLAGGLLSLQAKPGYAVYVGVAFLAGLLQQWAV